jgi:transposase
MYVDVVPNRSSPPAILLRESVREGRTVRKRTLANLSHWPPAQVELLRRVLRGETLVAPQEAFEVVRSRPHGHVAAVLGTLRRLGVDHLLGAHRSRQRDRCEAMIVARLLDPRSKLATARGLGHETLFTSLSEAVGVEDADEDELYQAMDWLVARQARIEVALAKRHLHEGALVLYDVTSTYFEGRTCPLAHLGFDRDGQRGRLQIIFGLLCTAEGCPIAVEVFDGNTGDPTTLRVQIEKVRTRFGLARVVFVGDRGMLTDARIREDLRPHPGLDWITALRAPAIRELVRAGALQLSLFDERDLVEITSSEYPGERLIVCRNPLLAQERARKREDLLRATERDLAQVAAATRRPRRPLRGQAQIGQRVGKVLGRFKVAKHFRITITDADLRYERDDARIAQEAALDGLYVIRTSVPAEVLSAPATVRAYKRLSAVERAFRSFKHLDDLIHPVHHRLPTRVRAHVFLCFLAYYVEWHMRQALAPLLFDDDDPAAAEAQRASVVQPARRSPQAQRKAQTKHTADGLPVHSFQTLLQDLATVVKNRARATLAPLLTFEMITVPTPLQQRAFDLLGVDYRL